MGNTIVVTSGKGGTGKTTAVGAIASCLAALGHRTLCIDCDVGMKNLDIVLGLSDFALMDFTDVLEGRSSLDSAAVAHPRIENLYFLSAPSSAKPEDVNPQKMSLLIDEVKRKFEFCLIDSPAGLGPGFRLAATGADMAIVVVTGDTTSFRDGQRAVAELHAMNIPMVRLLVNRVGSAFSGSDLTVDDVIDSVGAKLIGIVAEDEKVTLAANSETPLILYESKNAAVQFLRVSKRITGKRVPLGKF